jgi:SulP family sulfate permease
MFPVSIGVALAAGVSPQYGVNCAVVAGTVASIASRAPILAWPSLSLVALAGDVFARHGPLGVSTFTAVTGAWLLFLHAAGLARALARVPTPLTASLKTTLAVMVAARMTVAVLAAPGDRAGEALALAIAFAVGVLARPRLGPGGATLAGVTLAAAALRMLHRPVAGMPSLGLAFAAPVMPSTDWNVLQSLVLPALCTAVVSAVESMEQSIEPCSPTQFRPGEPRLLPLGLASAACCFLGGVPARGRALNTELPVVRPPAGFLSLLVPGSATLVLASCSAALPAAPVYGVGLAHILSGAGWEESINAVRRSPATALAWLACSAAYVALDLSTATLVVLALAALLVSRAEQLPMSRPGQVH